MVNLHIIGLACATFLEVYASPRGLPSSVRRQDNTTSIDDLVNDADLGPDMASYFENVIPTRVFAARPLITSLIARPLNVVVQAPNDKFNITIEKCATRWNTTIGRWNYLDGTTSDNATWLSVRKDALNHAHQSGSYINALWDGLEKNAGTLSNVTFALFQKYLNQTNVTSLDAEASELHDELRHLLQVPPENAWRLIAVMASGTLATTGLAFATGYEAFTNTTHVEASDIAIFGTLAFASILATGMTAFAVGRHIELAAQAAVAQQLQGAQVPDAEVAQILLAVAGVVAHHQGVLQGAVFLGGLAAAAASSTIGDKPTISQQQLDQGLLGLGQATNDDLGIAAIDQAESSVTANQC